MKMEIFASLLTFAVTRGVASVPAESGSTPLNSNISVVDDWSQIKPSFDLNWVKCFDAFVCTRLVVPLDYGHLDVGNTSIPILKSLAAVNPAPNMVVNPGGPGLTATDFLVHGVSIIRQKFGAAQNIVAFDPRGTGASDIDLSCFPDATEVASLATFLETGSSQSPQAPLDAFHRAQAYSQRCNIELGGNGTARYASTPAVARDMLSYVEAEARAAGQDVKQAKLRYLGASYGTLLGQTYAAIFPDRIDRMILDGNVDGGTYYQGLAPPHPTEADAALEGFFEYCHQAGPDTCTFFQDSAAAISTRLLKLINQLDTNPIPIGNPSVSQVPTLVTSFQLRDYIFNNFLYNPLTVMSDPTAGFFGLAQMLIDLERRNASSLVLQGAYGEGIASGKAGQFDNNAAGQAILCMDNFNHRVPLKTVADYEDWLRELRDQSVWVGNTQAFTRLACVGMEIEPPPMGRFMAPLPPSAPNTSFPILVVNTNRDPASPSTDAQKVSRSFPGSRLVLLNAIGHTTWSSPSKCLDRITLAYMQKGTLPSPGSICQPDELPFGLKP